MKSRRLRAPWTLLTWESLRFAAGGHRGTGGWNLECGGERWFEGRLQDGGFGDGERAETAARSSQGQASAAPGSGPSKILSSAVGAGNPEVVRNLKGSPLTKSPLQGEGNKSGSQGVGG